jgi:hypothetical protein
MDELSYSEVKLYSITYYIVKKYKIRSLISLYRQYLLKKLSKEQFILIALVCKSYKKNKTIQNSVLYKFIDYYIRNHTTTFFKKLIFD